MVSKVWRFEVERELASNPLGSIYKAKDPKSGRVLAVRTVRLDAPGAQEFLRRLMQQAKAAKALNSPNIASMYGGGTEAGFCFVALEFVSGASLRELIARRYRFSPTEFIDLARQICSALDHAQHSHNFHTALHPGNILVEMDGTAKLMDFAIPKDIPAEGDERRCYLSPEQLNGATPDLRSNLFSWGAILYELVTGQKAFTGSDRGTAPRAPHEINATVPVEISHAILKALAKDPAERFSHGDEFVAALESYKQAARPVPPPVPTATMPPPQSSTYAAMPPGPSPVTISVPQPNAAVEQAAPVVEHVYTGPLPGQPKPETPPAAPPAVRRATREFKRAAHEAAVRLRAPETEARVKKSLPYAAWAIAALAFLFLGLAGYYFIEGRVEAWREQRAATASPAAAPQPPPTSPAETPAETPVAEAEPEAGSLEAAAVAVRRARRDPVAASRVPAAAPLTTGEMAISSVPDGATVQIDGRSQPDWRTPFVAASVRPGTHTIALIKPGYEPRSETLRVEAGKRTTFAASLNELGVTVNVTSQPAGASIFVDGKDSGRVTPSRLALAKGVHRFALRRPGFFEYTSELVISGQTAQVNGSLKFMGNVEQAKTAGKLSKFLPFRKDMASLQIRTQPKGGRVVINGRTMDKSTPAEFFLPEGYYEIVITVNGYKPLRKMVGLQTSSKTVIDEALQK